jgi:hypothetical protein
MRKGWLLATAAVLAAAAATGGVVAISGAEQATSAAQEPPVNTAMVEKGRLSDMVSHYGILTYRARSDGSEMSGAATCSAASSTSITPSQHEGLRFPRPTRSSRRNSPSCAHVSAGITA